MINFNQRSTEKELLDEDNIPSQVLVKVLRELNFINTWLGGHAITRKGIVHTTGYAQTLTICEIGCGGGDNLFAIYKYCLNKNINVSFIGVDLNEGCIKFAKQQYPQLNCKWICGDYSKTEFYGKPDIIFSSLFCHHFSDDDLIKMLYWLNKNSHHFFINDLQRNALPYYLIKFLTKIFSRSKMVKNDACLSVARGFTKKDWINLFNHSNIHSYKITWQWAFRWLVIVDSKQVYE